MLIHISKCTRKILNSSFLNLVRLIFLFNLLLTIFGPSVCFASSGSFGGSLGSRIELAPTERNPITRFESELVFTYEHDSLSVESETEFDLEGYSEETVKLELPCKIGYFRGKLEFGKDLKFPECLTGKGSIEIGKRTRVKGTFTADYSKKDSPAGNYETEYDIELDHEFFRSSSLTLGLEFQPAGEIHPLPSEVLVELNKEFRSGLEGETSVQFDDGELDDCEVELDSPDNILNSGLSISGSWNWSGDETILEMNPEFQTEYATLSCEISTRLSRGVTISTVDLEQVEITDFYLRRGTVDLSHDFHSGETELEFTFRRNNLELELDFTHGQTEDKLLPGEIEFTGELTWFPRNDFEFEVELVLGDSESSKELSASAIYEF